MPQPARTLAYYPRPGAPRGLPAGMEAGRMEPQHMLQVASDVGTRFGVRIVGAIALWIIGRAVINFVGRLINRWLVHQHLDPTLGRYIASAATIVLNLILVIALP